MRNRLYLVALSVLLPLSIVPAAQAQVMQIGDDGSVLTLQGPTLTTRDGTIAQIVPVLPASPVPPIGGGVAAARIAGARVVPIGLLGSLFDTVAERSGVDARLLRAVAWQESRFRHASISPKGAVGIMQLMPDTARGLGVDARDLTQNLAGGARLLATLLRQYGGDLNLALAAYNAGPGAVQRYGGIPPYRETQDYVRRIRSYLSL